jgi:hypothetical protein
MSYARSSVEIRKGTDRRRNVENICGSVTQSDLSEVDFRFGHVRSRSDLWQQGAQFLPALATGSASISARK